MSAEPLQFWFEFASTYSYLAVCRVGEVAGAAGVPVRWRPFLLGPIFQAQGWNDSPFNIYPAKGRYMWRDMERLCARHRIAFTRPSRFPRNGLLAARVACLGATQDWCPEFVRRVFHANFADDREISQLEIITDILDNMGLPGQALCEQACESEAKVQLHRQTDEAFNLGIFGAPSFVVDKELFWGNERLEDAIEWYCRNRGDRDTSQSPA